MPTFVQDPADPHNEQCQACRKHISRHFGGRGPREAPITPYSCTPPPEFPSRFSHAAPTDDNGVRCRLIAAGGEPYPVEVALADRDVLLTAFLSREQLAFVGFVPIVNIPAPAPIPMLLTCPCCGERHIDEGWDGADKPHHTHVCQTCGMVWRPALVATVGVRFLPGFKNKDS